MAWLMNVMFSNLQCACCIFLAGSHWLQHANGNLRLPKKPMKLDTKRGKDEARADLARRVS